MSTQQLIEHFKKNPHIEVKINEDLSRHSTMRLKSRGNLIVIQNVESLKEVVCLFRDSKLKYRILGNGSNQALSATSDNFYLKLQFPFDRTYLETPKQIYTLPASVMLSNLTSHAVRFGNKGWENFTGVPGSLGGAVAMNAGTGLGEIGVLIRKVMLIDANGNICERSMEKDSFSYRKNHFLRDGDIIFSVEMTHFGFDSTLGERIKNYLDYRNKTQPMAAKTCGCTFKNYSDICRAGLFLDLLGLKGFVLKSIRVSPLHANFLENLGDADSINLKNMIRLIQEEVLLYYGLSFELEIKLE